MPSDRGRERVIRRMPSPGEPRRRTVTVQRRGDLLDFDVGGVSDADAMTAALVREFDGRHLHAEVLADQRSEIGHRTAHLAGEDARELWRARKRPWEPSALRSPSSRDGLGRLVARAAQASPPSFRGG